MRNTRGRKQTVHEDNPNREFEFTKAREGNLSAFATKPIDKAKLSANANNINHTISYCDSGSVAFPRPKTNSRKRGAVIIRAKDSRNAQSTQKKKEFIQAVDGVKTIEYADKDNFRSINARSNTVQKKRKLQTNNFTANEGIARPYSNFAPSVNTRSNITIDRSGSVGYGKLKPQLQNSSILSQI